MTTDFDLDKEEEDFLIGKTIFSKYKIIRKIGQGSFGSIYESQSKYSNKYYAIKYEDMKKNYFFLEEESIFLSYLNFPRIPKIKSFGYCGSFIILVMELLGKSLDKILIELPNNKMSIRCVCNIAYQLITIFQIIHNCNIIHRDIKPGNIAVGREEKSKYIYLLDFGLSKKYRSSKTKNHYPFIKNHKLVGTVRYSSINALDGCSLSRRDDLESLGYCLIYLIFGRLPWQGCISSNKEDKYYKIKQIKKNTTPKDLCKELPPQFEEYIRYTRNLEYETEPDYNYLRYLFLSLLKKYNFEFDYYYDWDNVGLTSNEIKDIEKGNNNLNYFLSIEKKIPKICRKISDLIVERKKLGGIFDIDRFVFDDDEESNNIVKLKSGNQKKETDFDYINNYSNSITPYAYPKEKKARIKSSKNYKSNKDCCKIF